MIFTGLEFASGRQAGTTISQARKSRDVSNNGSTINSSTCVVFTAWTVAEKTIELCIFLQQKCEFFAFQKS